MNAQRISNGLHPYQEEGVRFLVARKRAILADDMGLGKTAQAIRAADAVSAQWVLMVVPAIARQQTAREWARFSLLPRQITVIDSGKKALPETPGVVVINYDLLEKFRKGLLAYQWDVLILDEVQAIKSISAKRTLAVCGSGRSGKGILSVCQRVWAMSGTPAPNGSHELYVLARAVVPDIARSLGISTYSQWLDRFSVCIETTHDPRHPIRNKNSALLAEVLKPHFLRRRKGDVLRQLPPLTLSEHVVEADSAMLKSARANTDDRETLRKMDSIVRDCRGELEDVDLDEIALGTIRRLTGRLKARPTAEFVSELLDRSAGEKAIVFAYHREVIFLLETLLKRFQPQTLYGGTTPANRQKAIEAFTNQEPCRVLIGQIDACNSALNLQAASLVVFAEQSWVPSQNSQAIARAWRMGQTRPVTAYTIGLAGSLDEAINGVLTRKLRGLDELFGAFDRRADAF